MPANSESTTTPAQNALALTLQNLATSLIAVIALIVIHEFILQCRSILLPFVLSGFIVLSVEPYVNSMYGHLAGHLYPHRWCICCCQRRLRKQSQLGRHPSLARASNAGTASPSAPGSSAQGEGRSGDSENEAGRSPQKESGGESSAESSTDSWWSDS